MRACRPNRCPPLFDPPSHGADAAQYSDMTSGTSRPYAISCCFTEPALWPGALRRARLPAHRPGWTSQAVAWVRRMGFAMHAPDLVARVRRTSAVAARIGRDSSPAISSFTSQEQEGFLSAVSIDRSSAALPMPSIRVRTERVSPSAAAAERYKPHCDGSKTIAPLWHLHP